MRGALEPWHLAILAVIFMALFGAKRLPDSARSLGESLHIFKKSMSAPEEPAVAVEPRQTARAVESAKPAEPPTV
jgi:sec-independent protein translocase protein TatA